MNLFPQPAEPAPEPQWLAAARRRSLALGEQTSITAADRRALLKGYDELAARLSTVEAERDAAKVELDEVRGVLGNGFRGDTLLSWCLRYGSAEDLDYVFDKLSRRCPAGKALVERAEKAEAANTSLKQQLAEQEREKLALVQEAVCWLAPASKEPFAFVAYLVAVKQDEGLNKGEITTLKRTCHWDSVAKEWVRHGVSPRSVLSKEVVYYAEIPAAPTSLAPLLEEAVPAAGQMIETWVPVSWRPPSGRVKVRTAEGYEALVVVNETDQGQRYVTCVEWDNPNFSFGLVVGKVVEWCEEVPAAALPTAGLFVLMKSSRVYYGGCGYQEYQPTSRAQAESDAVAFTKLNPVGFTVEPYRAPEKGNPEAGALPTTGEGVEPSPFVFGGHPNAAQQRAIKLARPEVGTIWQLRKRADEQVIICESTRWDSVAFRRHPACSNSDFNRLRYKKHHYFLAEYEPAPTTGQGKEQANV